MSRTLRRLAVVLVCFSIYHFATILRSSLFMLTEKEFVVCVIGNAPDEAAAERVFRMWEGRLATTYYLWNTTSPRQSGANLLTFVPMGSRRRTFAEGMELALVQARRRVAPACDYFFTHDDDLKFFLGQNRTGSLVGELLRLLASYRPLLASFPWDAGLRSHANLASIHEAWGADEVGPMVAFDNGMVIYHTSVVDFFIPFSPRGEGQFVGHWTLGAHFINLFATLAFPNDSICINSLRYNNTINIDNLLPAQRNAWETDNFGLVHYRGGSRHPYEWPLNAAYKRFLAGGLKCIENCRWGRDLSLSDVTAWRIQPFANVPSRSEIARKVAKVFHLQHEALLHNALIGALSLQELRAAKASFYSLRISVFTYDRPDAFKRLWQSLQRAVVWLKSECSLSVHVYQDYDPQESVLWRRQRALIANLPPIPGVVTRTIFHASHQGLRSAVLTSWAPRTDDEFCLFLEDDIELADLSLHYVDSVIRKYWYENLPSRKLIGISLYRPRYSEVTESDFFLNHASPLFLYEYPSSWGEVFASRSWLTFLSWLSTANGSFLIPNSYTNRWPSSTSWKKPLLRWMIQTGCVMIYPNMFGNYSLSTNHLERGTNDRLEANSSARAAMMLKFTVPLVPSGSRWPPLRFPQLGSIPQVNAWDRSVRSVEPQDVAGFDTCTVVISLRQPNTWLDRLLYWRNASFVSSVAILWGNVSRPPPSQVPALPFTVRFFSKSFHTRFLPDVAGSTECMIAVDDDFDMPLSSVSFAVHTWRGHFWNHVVGFASFGRNHYWDPKATAWVYSMIGHERFSSILLSTCMVYHRKYHYLYASLPQAALRYVDQVTNCADILFNFLVSNTTRSAPVVVSDVWPSFVSTDASQNQTTRSHCLNYFFNIFGQMPLRYTSSYFSPRKSYGTSPGVPPGLRHHRSSVDVPS